MKFYNNELLCNDFRKRHENRFQIQIENNFIPFPKGKKQS